jgi:hypothetical protein
MATQGAGDGAMNDELAIGMELADGSTPDQQIVEDAPAAAAAPGPAPPEPTTWTDREYVYGPDYVDEIIAQIPPAAGQAFAPASARGPVMYVLQDANYNVVALVATNGNLLEQYAYEPYGTLAARDDFGNHAVNRVGHQGLFFERFDGTYADGTLDIAPPGAALGPIGIGLYFARNRFYGPGIGRWTTADPNETGLPIVSALAMNGRALDSMLAGLNAEELYGDGMSLCRYLTSNPITRRDPAGLFTLAEVAAASGELAWSRSDDANRVGMATLLLMTLLGTTAVVDQGWGVGGGLTNVGYEMFVEGVAATMSAEYYLGEALMVAGEATALTVFALSQADAVKKATSFWPVLVDHFEKLSTGGPGDWNTGPKKWLSDILRYCNRISELTRHMGRKTAKNWADWIERCIRAGEEAIRTGSGKPPPMPG